ncbi:hypothetical protein BpHYR1_019355 [Brachionus plicatilis]|uniref:Uncharacterized protein n=1 Tax=Brachionus plicatilis TaxID=10195 RepID=A0A3M7QNS3_BRAPC|nr:hypothetical protein BpHYR1_019355 [Brachionus plicatilis]
MDLLLDLLFKKKKFTIKGKLLSYLSLFNLLPEGAKAQSIFFLFLALQQRENKGQLVVSRRSATTGFTRREKSEGFALVAKTSLLFLQSKNSSNKK